MNHLIFWLAMDYVFPRAILPVYVAQTLRPHAQLRFPTAQDAIHRLPPAGFANFLHDDFIKAGNWKEDVIPNRRASCMQSRRFSRNG
jgi:hypothetical protein